jgi:hypothetical protein
MCDGVALGVVNPGAPTADSGGLPGLWNRPLRIAKQARNKIPQKQYQGNTIFPTHAHYNAWERV